jgi:hypothetical protein
VGKAWESEGHGLSAIDDWQSKVRNFKRLVRVA